MSWRIRDEISEYPYDPETATEIVEIKLEDEDLLRLAAMAHERDITLNHLMCAIIHLEIERLRHVNVSEAADELAREPGDSTG